MKMVFEKIAHECFAIESIKVMEKKVLCVIQFSLTFPTILDFLDHLIESFVYDHERELKEKHWTMLRRIKNLSLYFAKMSRYDYSMLEYRYWEFFYLILVPLW